MATSDVDDLRQRIECRHAGRAKRRTHDRRHAPGSAISGHGLSQRIGPHVSADRIDLNHPDVVGGEAGEQRALPHR